LNRSDIVDKIIEENQQKVPPEIVDLTQARETNEEHNSLNLAKRARGDGFDRGLDNLRKILSGDSKLKGAIQYNTFTYEIEVTRPMKLNGRTLSGAIDDLIIREIRAYIATKYKIDYKKGDIADILEVVAGEHSYNPLKDYLESCESEYKELVNQRDPFAILRHYLNIKDACIRCQIDSAIPEKRGMGSSAAISIAAIRAVFDYYQAELPHDVLEILVNRAEMIAHMNPSGLDAKTCLSDQPIRFIKNVGFEELAMDLSAYLVIADTGVYGHTREAIQVVESKGKEALPFLYALGELTQQAEEAIKAKDAVKLGEILIKAHGNLKEIGVSSLEADALVETALEHGALGAKMSGGGLGGCIIALVADYHQAQDLAERLEEKGAVQTWIESL